VVVVGMGVGVDQFTPFLADKKEIDLRFVGTYTPLEFRDTLHMLADGKVDPRPLITGPSGSTAWRVPSPRYGIPRRTRRSSSIQHHRARTAPPPCGEAA